MLTFYAELLPNIKSISLLITLPTPATTSTRATVDVGSVSATLHHNGEYTYLVLPGPANPGPRQLVIIAGHGEKTLSCRLPLASSTPGTRVDHENHAPWSAPDISSRPLVCYCCRSCSAVLIPEGRIKQWKDLPSGNWADMMDFWHCHKPHEDSKGKAHDGGGKYSTFGKGFVVEQGTGLVDRCYFLFSSKDCEAAQIDGRVVCSTCRSLLGAPENDTPDGLQLWRLNKCNLSLNGSESHPLECFLSSQFISYVEEEGVRRLLVTCEEMGTRVTSLKVWIFNLDIRYTHTHSNTPIRGLKIFWQTMKLGESVPTDSLKSTGFQAVELGAKAFDLLKTCLDDSNKELPSNIGKCGEWKVGVLRRFGEMNWCSGYK